MFRIGFDHETGKFVIQVRQRAWLIFSTWKTVRVREFETHQQARQWVKRTGLGTALREVGPAGFDFL